MCAKSAARVCRATSPGMNNSKQKLPNVFVVVCLLLTKLPNLQLLSLSKPPPAMSTVLWEGGRGKAVGRWGWGSVVVAVGVGGRKRGGGGGRAGKSAVPGRWWRWKLGRVAGGGGMEKRQENGQAWHTQCPSCPLPSVPSSQPHFSRDHPHPEGEEYVRRDRRKLGEEKVLGEEQAHSQ